MVQGTRGVDYYDRCHCRDKGSEIEISVGWLFFWREFLRE